MTRTLHIKHGSSLPLSCPSFWNTVCSPHTLCFGNPCPSSSVNSQVIHTWKPPDHGYVVRSLQREREDIRCPADAMRRPVCIIEMAPTTYFRNHVSVPAERNATVPKQKPRPVQGMYTPTGPRFLRKFRSGSVAHEAVVVGDHNSKDSVLKSELHRSIGNEIKHMTKLKPQAAAVEDLNNRDWLHTDVW